MKKMTQVEMETGVMKFLTGIEMKQHAFSPEMEFFGREPISRDISCFLQIRLSLIYLIAKSKFMTSIDIEDIEQEDKVIANINCNKDLSEKEKNGVMRLLILASKNIQTNLFNEWSDNPELAPKGPFLSLDTLRSLIVDSDKEMFSYFSNANFSKIDLMSFILDFHFSHSHLDLTLCKEIKVAIFELLKEQRDIKSIANTSVLFSF
ncbi:hypothetical protein JD488_10015 [Aeromonas jandaei]|uniref:hypothetical protein n=1 Tax=Aeromonas jandaei TaxID=650 RepID=UPI00191D76C6|nr:hypothetical protein [Aeromonas jandaei]MBL0667042.1 hypothetical protein [Aeromonas jandaei]